MAKKVPYDTSGNLDIRPNKERAKIAELLIWSVMLVDVISIWSSYLQYDLLVQLNNDTWIPDRVLDSNDIREQSIALIYVVVYIVSIVVFIRWFRRAYYNLGRRTECAHSEGWAAGNWFVPIISLFRPYQIMKEMWMKTTRLTLSKTQEKVQKDSVENIGIWWFLWILSNYVAKYATKRAFKAETIACPPSSCPRSLSPRDPARSRRRPQRAPRERRCRPG